MIELQNLTKSYRANGIQKTVARDINFIFPAQTTVALIGRNGAGKSSLLSMIAGLLEPDTGAIRTQGRVSWPVGFQGSFHPDLNGRENVRFLARIYGMDCDDMCAFVLDFAELDDQFLLPIRNYSAGMRARLAFAVSMAVPFDTYLIDEVTSVGDASFRRKSETFLKHRLIGKAAIIVSHSMELLKRLCISGAVLENGRIFYYQRVEKAIEHHNYLMQGQLPPWMRR